VCSRVPRHFDGGRQAFIEDIRQALLASKIVSCAQGYLLLSPYFREKVDAVQAGWRRVVAAAVSHGIPSPSLTPALSYFDGYRSQRLPANLLQAQRDYFGAHSYERTDRPRGEFFHTNWTGRGGDTASSTYDA